MTSYRNEELFLIYANYCSFGAGAKASIGDDSQIDNARFAKLAKETHLIDSVISSTEIDIMFNKHKEKGARKLGYEGFKRALAEIAIKKYRGKALGEVSPYEKLVDLIAFKGLDGPVIRSAVVSTKGAVYDKLTDTSLYTGSHKLRFDEEGKGRGIAGRADVNEKRKNENGSRPGLSSSYHNIVSSHTSQIQVSSEKLNRATTDRDNKRVLKYASSNESIVRKSNPAVFDRLTDVSTYKGTHQHRFNADGTGRGLEGRETIVKGEGSVQGKYRGGPVKSLSQILRN